MARIAIVRSIGIHPHLPTVRIPKGNQNPIRPAGLRAKFRIKEPGDFGMFRMSFVSLGVISLEDEVFGKGEAGLVVFLKELS